MSGDPEEEEETAQTYTGFLTLPTSVTVPAEGSGEKTVSLTWTADNALVNTATGALTAPAGGKAIVTLKAMLTSGSESKVKTFTLCLWSKAAEQQQTLDDIAAVITARNAAVRPLQGLGLFFVTYDANGKGVDIAFRRLLEGSELIARPKQHVQDPYSFRCIPQVHGASKDTIDYVEGVLTTEINSTTDNPTVFPEEDMVVSAGNFHGQPIALAMDFLAIALAELGSISERRTYKLISGARELPAFLVAKPGLNSGFMIPQYTAASIVSQSKGLCMPASVDSIPSSQGQEDHVSMGSNAATKLYRVVCNTERVLAIELIPAAQALEFRRPARSSETLERLVAEYRKEVPFIDNDSVMYPHIESSIRFIRKS